MKIIACLGNPGRKYKKTRHNIGFIIGEFLAKSLSISMKKKDFKSIFGTGKIGGQDVCIIMPQTYMNNSGFSIRQILKYYKSDETDLLVVHDEIELPFGTINFKSGGGHKGHNGLRSIVQEVGTSEFKRLRFGVGRPDNDNISVADYVLSNFQKEELFKIEESLPGIMEEVETNL
jgi:PTH1 family peptidyl-tRNA hydrolase